VDSQTGTGVSIALDAADYPHLSYCGDDYDLKYARLDGTGWHWEAVDDLSGSSALALDSFDYPHVCVITGNHALTYAYRDGTGWHAETADSLEFVSPGQSVSLALDDFGYPHVSYFVEVSWDQANFRYAHKDASGWQVDTVMSTGAVGPTFSMALDGDGYPRITYYAYDGCDLEYLYKDGAGWHAQTVDSGEYAGYVNSIDVDGVGRSHICYSEDGALKYARMVSPPVSVDPALPLRVAAVEIWPNPARGVVHARLAMPEGQGMVRLTVVDLLGRRVMSLQQPETTSPEATITLRLPESIPTGQYFLGVEGDGARQFVPITVVK